MLCMCCRRGLGRLPMPRPMMGRAKPSDSVTEPKPDTEEEEAQLRCKSRQRVTSVQSRPLDAKRGCIPHTLLQHFLSSV